MPELYRVLFFHVVVIIIRIKKPGERNRAGVTNFIGISKDREERVSKEPSLT